MIITMRVMIIGDGEMKNDKQASEEKAKKSQSQMASMALLWHQYGLNVIIISWRKPISM